VAELKKIAFVLDEFKLDSPAQHLLDRFLAGFHRDGKWTRPEDRLVAVSIPDEEWNAELDHRVKDFDLRRTKSLLEALQDADGVVVVGKGVVGEANDVKLRFIVKSVPEGCPVFIHGAAGIEANSVGRLRVMAIERKIPIASGTTVPVTWRLPEFYIERGMKLKRALAVVHGDFPAADFFGLEATMPITGRRAVEKIQHEVGPELRTKEKRWMVTGVAARYLREDIRSMIKEGGWEELLAAALSRSNSPLGKSVEDGRTQDLSDLDAFLKLIDHGRSILIKEIDGYQTMIVVANGAVKDFTMAVEAADGKIVSAQIYRPQGPARSDFDRLAEVIEAMFETGKAPWPFIQSFHEVSMLGILRYQSQYWYQQPEPESVRAVADEQHGGGASSQAAPKTEKAARRSRTQITPQRLN
jgi:hypothetical protein